MSASAEIPAAGAGDVGGEVNKDAGSDWAGNGGDSGGTALSVTVEDDMPLAVAEGMSGATGRGRSSTFSPGSEKAEETVALESAAGAGGGDRGGAKAGDGMDAGACGCCTGSAGCCR